MAYTLGEYRRKKIAFKILNSPCDEITTAAEPVIYLIPKNRPLIIAAQVSPINIDELFVSQDVTLRFSALDQRQTPELFGKVVKVSADAFVDETTRATYYRAEIILLPC
jgi:hypothetical protein